MNLLKIVLNSVNEVAELRFATDRLSMFIYSLNTLWYFVRNLDVTQFFISGISTGLQTFTYVAQEHLRSDAPPDTTVVRRESNMGPLVGQTHALPFAPRPPPNCMSNVYIWRLLFIIFYRFVNYAVACQKCWNSCDLQKYLLCNLQWGQRYKVYWGTITWSNWL